MSINCHWPRRLCSGVVIVICAFSGPAWTVSCFGPYFLYFLYFGGNQLSLTLETAFRYGPVFLIATKSVYETRPAETVFCLGHAIQYLRCTNMNFELDGFSTVWLGTSRDDVLLRFSTSCRYARQLQLLLRCDCFLHLGSRLFIFIVLV